MQLSALEAQLDLVQQDLVNVQQASLVDRQALVEVQEMMVGLREKMPNWERMFCFTGKLCHPKMMKLDYQ